MRLIAFFGFVMVAAVIGDAGQAFAAQAPSGGSTLGSMINNVRESGFRIPDLLSMASYLFGMYLGVMGIKKAKEHVESPQNMPFWEAGKRLLAGGAFFALPFVVGVVKNTISARDADITYSGFNGKASGGGLDSMMVRLISDILVPSLHIIGWFGWIAGLFLVFIGISRLMQSEQQGPKGPAGIGTIMTFIIAGCLFSLNSIITYLNNSVFGSSKLYTNATLVYTQGLGDSAAHAHAVISSILAFCVILGWISIVRGLFIMRGISEGSGQASMMAALTHLIGGVMAINLGAVINAVQATLDIAKYGIKFT
ncbi:MAG: hypothetical protein DI626_00895 [Micavibrio aeruginosavorus]|uniref:Type IV secretion protein IcmC n=1 Tax=Micavibrio aeruginosavorus TaxID=349221 RepID=A0A2W5A6I4_9BACT|nr:MAG: hypothetical protein DI626_00895 [Micavibrio aeruginosavorus]